MYEFPLGRDEPVFTIEVTANLLDIRWNALKAYNAEDLLCPKENSENELCYSLNDINRAEVIKYLAMHLKLDLISIKLIMGLLETSGVPPQDYLKEIEKYIYSAS